MGRFFTLGYSSANASGAASPTSGGNISYGFAGTAANDASDGDTAWTNPGNAGPSNDADATVTFNNTSSQWLKITNFDLGGPISSIPAGASINGIEFHVEAVTSSTTPVLADLAIVKGGVIGPSLTVGDHVPSAIVGQYEYRGLMIGGPADLFGETWTAADLDSDFGVAIRLSSTGTETVNVDGIRVIIRWAMPAAATVTLHHATTPMAKTYIGFDCLQSYIGDDSWELVDCSWAISGPGGWGEHSTTDYRPGSWGSSRSRSMKTDFVGYSGSIYADTAGTYTFTVTMLIYDYATGAYSSITANDSVTVAADTRTVRYLDPGNGDDGDDGTTAMLAWNTWAYAISQLSDNYRLVVAGDTTETVSTAVSNRTFSSLTNVVVEWDGAGAKPIITAGANTVPVLAFDACTDFVIDGIDMRGKTSAEEDVLGATGDVERFVIANCAGSQGYKSFWEKTASDYFRGLLVWNSTFSSIHRYAFYIEGMRDRHVHVIGCQFTSSSTNPPTGEGLIRIGSHYDSTGLGGAVGYGFSFLWNDLDANSQSHVGMRLGGSFVMAYQNNYGDSIWQTNELPDDQKIFLQFVRVFDGCYKSDDVDGFMVPPERAAYFCARNNVVITSAAGARIFSQIQKRGHHVNSLFAHNAFLVTTSGASATFLNLASVYGSTGRATAQRCRWVANAAFTPTDVNPNVFWDEFSSPGMLGDGGELKNNVSAPRLDQDSYHKIANTNYDNAATVNALSNVSGEGVATKDIGGGPLYTSDVNASSRNFAPTSGVSTEYEEWAVPEPGVYRDYAGTLRNMAASTWAAGPTIIS